eukprot:3451556-Rhodomonas_salina.1
MAACAGTEGSASDAGSRQAQRAEPIQTQTGVGNRGKVQRFRDASACHKRRMVTDRSMPGLQVVSSAL